MSSTGQRTVDGSCGSSTVHQRDYQFVLRHVNVLSTGLRSTCSFRVKRQLTCRLQLPDRLRWTANARFEFVPASVRTLERWMFSPWADRRSHTTTAGRRWLSFELWTRLLQGLSITAFKSWRRGSVSRTLVWRTFPDLYLIYGWLWPLIVG